jgi:hypothetical protein
MNLASEFANLSLDAIKELLNGGTLTVYSVARPLSADLPVDRSSVLATFTFATPAFGPADGGYESPNFEADAVTGTTVGTPGFLRARKADGTTVADFSAGPGDREIKFTEVSVSHGAPVRIVKFRFKQGDWPERPDYYGTKPRPGYPLPAGA